MNELGPMIHDERMAHKAAVCKHMQVYTNTYTCIFGGRGGGGAVPGEGPRTKAHGPRRNRPGGFVRGREPGKNFGGVFSGCFALESLYQIPFK